jgi:hypothetical protein
MMLSSPPSICIYCDHIAEVHEDDKCLKIVNNKVCICRKFKEFKIPVMEAQVDMSRIFSGLLGGQQRTDPFKFTD